MTPETSPEAQSTMGLWYRVFGQRDNIVPPDGLLAYLHTQGIEAAGRFDGEDDWLSAEIILADSMILSLERFPSTETGLRAELNSWAAYVETYEHEPEHGPLMERVIQTRQLFTLHQAKEPVDPLTIRLCQYLARVTEGVYQVDTWGFFTAEGTLLLREV